MLTEKEGMKICEVNVAQFSAVDCIPELSECFNYIFPRFINEEAILVEEVRVVGAQISVLKMRHFILVLTVLVIAVAILLEQRRRYFIPQSHFAEIRTGQLVFCN